jgi:uncharacterized coiled-coil protein SlyX
LWQELEVLQKKKLELDGQILSLGEKEKTLEERMKVIEEGLGLQEERVQKLEVQLKDKHEAMSKLDSRIAGLEKILKKPAKEPVKEPVKEEPVKVLVTAPEMKTEQIPWVKLHS